MPSSDTQWKPGQSGNPNGWTKARAERHRLFKELIEPRSEELVNQALSIALSDSKDRTKILTIFLERILPAVIKDNELDENIELKDGKLLEQANHIKKLLNDKYITPTEANVLLSNIKLTSDIKYKEDLEKRIEELEAEIKVLKKH